MSISTETRFSISPYFASYVPGRSSSSATKTVDRLLSDAGSFGFYQICVFLVLGLLSVVPSMVTMSFDLNVGTPKHRCRLSPNDTFENSSRIYEKFLKILPANSNSFEKSCSMLKDEFSQEIIPCQNGFVFDMEKYGETLSTDLSLVCEKFHLRALTQNIFSTGVATSVFTGILSDHWGRRKTIYFLVLVLIFSLNTMEFFFYSKDLNFFVFCVCRFFQGFSITFHSISLVLLSELTGGKGRVVAANVLAFFYALGEILLALIARHLKNYKLTFWALNVYVLPFAFLYLLIPESPLWLVQKNRLRQARKVFERIFYVNCRTLKNRNELFYSNLFDDVIASRKAEEDRPSYMQVFKRLYRSKSMRKRCLLVIGVWAAALFVYLAVNSALPTLTERSHEIVIAGGISEMIALVVCHLFSLRVERRRLLVLFFVMTGFITGLVPFTYDGQRTISVSLVLLGKLTASCCQLLIVVYATETYPTALRSTGVGLSASIARLVAMIGPQLAATQYSICFSLPFIFYSIVSFVAALAASQLPHIEKPCKLSDSMHQTEKQKIKISPVIFPGEMSFDQRRPSRALIREFGVSRPSASVTPMFSVSKLLSRRFSENQKSNQRLNRLQTSFSTINTIHEDTENNLTGTESMANLQRVVSLPTRFSYHRRKSVDVLENQHQLIIESAQ